MPGRMAFVFDLDDEFPQELPTTLLRSKEDCPKEALSMAGRIDPLILEKVSKVLTFLRQGSKSQKKLKKKDKGDGKGNYLVDSDVSYILTAGDEKDETEDKEEKEEPVAPAKPPVKVADPEDEYVNLYRIHVVNIFSQYFW